jgi:hypothetical protein
MPVRFPDPQVKPKLNYLPGRKRALTGREAAEQQERDNSRARKEANRLASLQTTGDQAMEENNILRRDMQDAIAGEYIGRESQDAEEDSDNWVDIDDLLPSSKTPKPQRPQLRCPPGKAEAVWNALWPKPQTPITSPTVSIDSGYKHSSQQKSQVIDGGYISSNDSELGSEDSQSLRPEFVLEDASDAGYNSHSTSDSLPSLHTLCTQAVEKANAAAISPISPLLSPSLASPSLPSRPQRARKPTAKQASLESQVRRKRAEKDKKLKKNPKKKDVSQLVDSIELPFRSSQ